MKTSIEKDQFKASCLEILRFYRIASLNIKISAPTETDISPLVTDSTSSGVP